MLYIEVVEKWYFSRSLRALIFSRNFSEELSRKNEMDLSWECYLNFTLRCQYIFSLIWSNLSFSWWKKKIKKERKKILNKIQETKIRAIRYFPAGIICGPHGDHLRFGIICGPIWGSFPVWGSFAVGDHLRRCISKEASYFRCIRCIVLYLMCQYVRIS